jgi:hypothetical protein
MAAAISAATSTISAAIPTAFWLIVVCPRCLPPPLPPLAVDAIATVAAAAAPCPLLLPLQLLDVQNITFKIIRWH